MICFFLGYGFLVLLLILVIESRWYYCQGFLSSIVIWVLVCVIFLLFGLLLGMLIVCIVFGVVEGLLFFLKMCFINDNFVVDEIGKLNVLIVFGVLLGLVVGFLLVIWLMVYVGWIGFFYVLVLFNLLFGGGLIWWFFFVL